MSLSNLARCPDRGINAPLCSRVRHDARRLAMISFLLCMLLGMAVPDWGLHRPWLQFYLGLTGFDVRSLGLGVAQSLAFGGYAGVLIALLLNFFNRRFR